MNGIVVKHARCLCNLMLIRERCIHKYIFSLYIDFFRKKLNTTILSESKRIKEEIWILRHDLDTLFLPIVFIFIYFFYHNNFSRENVIESILNRTKIIYFLIWNSYEKCGGVYFELRRRLIHLSPIWFKPIMLVHYCIKPCTLTAKFIQMEWMGQINEKVSISRHLYLQTLYYISADENASTYKLRGALFPCKQ